MKEFMKAGDKLMKAIYVSSACTTKKYNDLFCNTDHAPYQSQKYHNLLISGIANNNVDVIVLSILPINRAVTKKLVYKKSTEKVNNILYIYIPFINMPILRQISSFLSSLFILIKISKADFFLIVDILTISLSTSALLISKFLKIKSVAIVTDLPGFVSNETKSMTGKLYQFNNYILSKYDSYLYLTEQMNTLLNKNKKPYIVMEGHVDINIRGLENSQGSKYNKKICIYSGTIEKIYGLKNLVEAFIEANVDDAELHIYGSGSYTKELTLICDKYPAIKYFGTKSNEYIVKEQIKATLLINPRPTTEEFTKYSFPSKNMEYMASGTPTLTTKLPGMPKEYYNYVYIIEDEAVSGISKSLRETLSKSKEELHAFGLDAKKWVINAKNNSIQGKKVIDFVASMNTEATD